MNLISSIKDVAASELSDGLAFEWTELTYLQLIEGSAAIFAFIGAVLLVYLVLAAQYESWSMPMAVLRVVPMCLLIALAGMWMWMWMWISTSSCSRSASSSSWAWPRRTRS